MKITFDPVKRAVTLAERGLDFEDAAELFRGDTLDSPDDVISMRKANAREKTRFGKRFEKK